MPVVIGEIVTEIVVSARTEPQQPGATTPAGGATALRADDHEAVEAVVRRAAERVLETLRREWDR